MKAAVLEKYEKPLEIREVGVPVIRPEDVLVRVRACGICGTDLKVVSGKMPGVPLPHIPGHEIAGEVCKVGDRVTEVKIGDRVVVHPYLTCGVCRFCKAGMDSLCKNLKGLMGLNTDGGMAEFVKAPALNVIPFKSSISFSQAAILGDAVATPYHALRDKAGLREGEILVIVGVGGLGLHAVQIAKALGAKVLAVDINDRHLEKAAELGADMVLNPNRDNILEAIQGKTDGDGADVVIDLVGQPETLERDVEWLGPAGKLLLVGYDPIRPFSISSMKMVLKEAQIMGSRASTRRDLADVIKWVEEKKIIPVVEEVLPLTEVNKAYERLRGGKTLSRIVLEP